MIWVYNHENTNPTAGWLGWSQEMLRPSLRPRFGEREEDVTSLRYKFREHFDIIDGSNICAKFDPMDWIAILLYVVFCFYTVDHITSTVDHIMRVLEWMRPPAPACGSAHISLRLFRMYLCM